jgi:alkaline phosphatase
MFWDKKKRKEDSERYKQIEDNLGKSNIGDYNDESHRLRGKRGRKAIKKNPETRPQLVEEETKAIEFSESDKDGYNVARKSVNKKWWEDLL